MKPLAALGILVAVLALLLARVPTPAQGQPPALRGSVTVFLATDCPIAGRFARPVQRLADRFSPRGFAFVALFPNASETDSRIADWCRERQIRIPARRDPGGAAAARYGAEVTPEVVVTAPSGTVLYQGRIAPADDPARVDDGELARALEAVLAGKPVARPRTEAFGCEIAASRPAATPTDDGPTWARDIAPILFRNCVSCHRTGEVGPMPLDGYDVAARFARRIADHAAKRTMPPWQADSKGEFHDERRLTDREIYTIGKWARAGAPAGDLRAAPAPPPAAKGPETWKLGTPDATFALDTPYVTPADGKDHYRCFVFPNREDADRWIEGIEFLPGNKGAVHHVSAFVDVSGEARKRDAADPGPGYTNPTPGNGPGFPNYQVIGGWTPGHLPRRVPAGAGLPLPKGADIVVEVHYHLTGKAEIDLTRCALHFARGTVDKRYRVGDVGSIRFTLPAGKKDATVEVSDTLNADITIHSVTPHMHLLGRQMRVTAETPEGRFVKIIDIVRWDFGWQPSYRFKEPLRLPRGTRIDVRAVYDNSADNPDNPNRPPKDMIWGEGTDAEMCTVFFGYTMDSEHLASPR